MTQYEELVEDTEELVRIIHKKYMTGEKGCNVAYLPMLSGIGPCKVEMRPGAGHNYYAVVDAIHNCYKNDPDGGYDRGFADGIEALTRVSSAKVASLANLFNIIFYQLDKEKEGTAEFNVDIDEIMARVNKLIEDNKEVYRQDYASFDHWYERCQKIAREKYGLELG
ncbi:hypothetical protein SAMN04487830_12212 [Pseudobutyrivibrio sp. OR37]|uniref:hypothetical protein n=1 Tax=Pseudobutyrivibrio sp. OR37 TaxID=1798186 RepID=UPI0008E3BAEA|nr:hypothetical protein [Pseudobutyrivibrio sp. OR37]SFI09541.1 hypothetical protein SAMN04487830_12212 [Pseudobutyrivibrio sp. OR37]